MPPYGRIRYDGYYHPSFGCAASDAAGKYWKNKIGYVPCDKDNESVAKALEYAYDDWCISVLAGALDDEANRDKYAAFAEGYKVYFDPSTRFMRGLDSEGNWRTLSTPALPITVTMTIAKVRHGSGLGSFPTMWTDWWN